MPHKPSQAASISEQNNEETHRGVQQLLFSNDKGMCLCGCLDLVESGTVELWNGLD